MLASPVRVTINGPRRRNVHLGGEGSNGFNAGSNDPSARFENIRNAYSSLDWLTSAVAALFEPQQPQRRLIDVAVKFDKICKLRDEASSDMRRAFYDSALAVLTTKMNGFANQNNDNSTN